MRYRKGIFLVVFKKEKSGIKYLLLKRKLHWKGWECVKGGIEKGEKIKGTIKRELREETGLKPRKIIDMKKRKSFLYPKNFKGWPGFQGMIYHIFAVEVKSKKIKLDKLEHSGYKWLGFEKAYEKLTFKEQKFGLKIVNKKLSLNS